MAEGNSRQGLGDKTKRETQVVEAISAGKPSRLSMAGKNPPVAVRTKWRSVALIALCLIAGGIGSALQNNFAPSLTHSVQERKNLLIKEDSAVIEVAKKVSPSVVSITSSAVSTDIFGQSQAQDSAGTGIILSSDGLILTNKHVVEGGDNFAVITSEGKEYMNAKVVAKDPINDIAFVRIEAKGLPAAEIGDSSLVQVGQRVIAIGNALGQFQNSVTTGVISGKGRPITASGGDSAEALQNLFQTDAAINPGNSGGPLVNIDGQVIGINTAVAGQGAQNIGFAIPINEAKRDIVSVTANGKIVRPYLGVRYVTVTTDIASRNSLGKNTVGGAYIGAGSGDGVVSGSPSDKAGLQDDDIILKINGTKLNASNSLTSIIGNFKVGDTVTVTYVRDGKEKATKVTLREAPSLN